MLNIVRKNLAKPLCFIFYKRIKFNNYSALAIECQQYPSYIQYNINSVFCLQECSCPFCNGSGIIKCRNCNDGCKSCSFTSYIDCPFCKKNHTTNSIGGGICE